MGSEQSSLPLTALPLAVDQNMENTRIQTHREGGEQVKSYVFSVVLEQDEDVWRAYVPELEEKGAATWGKTKEEALKNIQEVAQMVIEVMLKDGEALPPSEAVSD